MDATVQAPRGPWLFGPASDLLFGCGAFYFLIFAISAAGGSQVREILLSPNALAVLVILLSLPHYGATILRVYDDPRERRRYRVFSIYATGAVVAIFVAGVYSPVVGSLVWTLQATWSPWHYTGQNYGIAVMLLRRAGVEITPAAKRWLYSSFLLSFALVFFALHAGGVPYFGASGTDPNLAVSHDKPIHFVSIGIPAAVADLAIPIVSGLYVLCLLGAGVTLRRTASWKALLPAAALALSQGLWFSVPRAVAYFDVETGIDPLSSEFRAQYFYWIALSHAIQYLWVTSYFYRSEREGEGPALYYLKILALGALVWTLPGLLFAPGALGILDYSGGLLLLISGTVNVHHFILDGAIWKLRNPKVAGILIRQDVGTEIGASAVRRSWLRHGVWSLAGASLAVAVAGLLLAQSHTRALVSRDFEAARTSLDWLGRLGRDGSTERAQLARLMLRNGDIDQAIAEYERSLELHPDPATYSDLGRAFEQRGSWTEAAAAYRSGLALDSQDPALFGHAARVAFQLGDRTLAVSHLRHALELDPDREEEANNLAWVLATTSEVALRNPEEALRLARRIADATPQPKYLDTLAAALAAQGDFEAAAKIQARAAEMAASSGDAEFSFELRERYELYRVGRAYVE